MIKKIAVMTLCLLLLTPLAWAQVKSSDPLSEKEAFKRWYFSVGPYGAALNTGASASIDKVGLGLNVDFEKLLGLDTTTFTFRIDGAYRAGKTGRHKITASWFAFRRNGENTVSEDIPIPPELGGEPGDVIPIGTTLEGKFNIDIIKTVYRYSIILDDRIDLNVGGGFYISPITFGIGVEGSDFADTSVTAPLPVIGLGLSAALTERWYVMAQTDLMYLEIENVKGGITDTVIGVEYRPFKKVGFGLRAESLRLGVEVEEDSDVPGFGSFIGDIDFGFTGASLYVSVFF
jgi:hypothetical protein